MCGCMTRWNGSIHVCLPSAIEDALLAVMRATSQNVMINNHAFHRLLVDGVDRSYRADGVIRHDKARLVDFSAPDANDFFAVNQFTITDVNITTRAKTNRRPNVIMFVNGLPLAVIELKNAANENANARKSSSRSRPTTTTFRRCSSTTRC